jgi:hypothetical protein
MEMLCIAIRCSTGKSWKATVTTDEKGVAVVKMKNEHNPESDEEKVKVKQLRVRISKQSGDITSRCFPRISSQKALVFVCIQIQNIKSIMYIPSVFRQFR